MDDLRLKRGGGGNYFDELLSRIRDIRSSEKVFWRKVLDIYATSIDMALKSQPPSSKFVNSQWERHSETSQVTQSRALWGSKGRRPLARREAPRRAAGGR